MLLVRVEQVVVIVNHWEKKMVKINNPKTGRTGKDRGHERSARDGSDQWETNPGGGIIIDEDCEGEGGTDNICSSRHDITGNVKGWCICPACDDAIQHLSYEECKLRWKCIYEGCDSTHVLGMTGENHEDGPWTVTGNCRGSNPDYDDGDGLVYGGDLDCGGSVDIDGDGQEDFFRGTDDVYGCCACLDSSDCDTSYGCDWGGGDPIATDSCFWVRDFKLGSYEDEYTGCKCDCETVYYPHKSDVNDGEIRGKYHDVSECKSCCTCIGENGWPGNVDEVHYISDNFGYSDEEYTDNGGELVDGFRIQMISNCWNWSRTIDTDNCPSEYCPPPDGCVGFSTDIIDYNMTGSLVYTGPYTTPVAFTNGSHLVGLLCGWNSTIHSAAKELWSDGSGWGGTIRVCLNEDTCPKLWGTLGEDDTNPSGLCQITFPNHKNLCLNEDDGFNKLLLGYGFSPLPDSRLSTIECSAGSGDVVNRGLNLAWNNYGNEANIVPEAPFPWMNYDGGIYGNPSYDYAKPIRWHLSGCPRGLGYNDDCDDSDQCYLDPDTTSCCGDCTYCEVRDGEVPWLDTGILSNYTACGEPLGNPRKPNTCLYRQKRAGDFGVLINVDNIDG